MTISDHSTDESLEGLPQTGASPSSVARRAPRPADHATGGFVWGTPRAVTWVDDRSSTRQVEPIPASVSDIAPPASDDAAQPTTAIKSPAHTPVLDVALAIAVACALMVGVFVLYGRARTSVAVARAQAAAAQNWVSAQANLPRVVWAQAQAAAAGRSPPTDKVLVSGDSAEVLGPDQATAWMLVSVVGNPVRRFADGTTSIKIDIAYPDAAVASADLLRDPKWLDRPASYRAGVDRLVNSPVLLLQGEASPSCGLVGSALAESAAAHPANEAQAHPHVTVSLAYPPDCLPPAAKI